MREKGSTSRQAENGKGHCHSIAQSPSDQIEFLFRVAGCDISNKKFLVRVATRSRSGRRENQANALVAGGTIPPKSQSGRRKIRNADVTI
jgi:hypothetical protein